MGMSASQARLIALTARMNDIEYQGQQINQQRTTLSNQTNSYNTQLLEMSVPTPPSTSDYTKIQYSGTMDASKFTIGNVVPTGQNNLNKNTYTIDFNYNRSGSSVSKSNKTTILTQTTPTLGYSNEGAVARVNDLLKTETVTKPDAKLETVPTNQDQEVFLAVSGSEYNTWGGLTTYPAYDQNGNEMTTVPNNDSLVFVKCKVEDLTTDAFKNIVKTDASTGNYTNLYSAVESENTSYVTTFNDDYIKGLNLYYIPNPSNHDLVPTQITSWKQLTELLGSDYDTSKIFVQDPTATEEENQYKNGDYSAENNTGYSVETNDGTKTVYTLDDPQAIEQLGGSYASYIESIKNAFPSEFTSSMTDKEVASKFFVYITKTNSGSIEPHFIRRDDISQLNNANSAAVVPYEYDEDGTYTVTEAKKDCQLEFDVSSGRITKIGIPDGKGQMSWVDVKSETVTDQLSYQDAMNNFEYEKAKYDKTQQDINAKISIVQQQDKSLELKLTRLDNERNAVNTEIEAVKKVVSENIEKSYKTFSG